MPHRPLERPAGSPPFHSDSTTWFARRSRSFVDAWNGLRVVVRTQIHFRLHLVAALVVLGAGWFLRLDRLDWILVTVSIALVLVAEAFNTSLEFLADAVTLEHNPQIGMAKDAAAGAVLISAAFALVAGGFVFVPRLASRIEPLLAALSSHP